MKQAVEALGSLSQESRLRVFRFLVTQGPEGASVGTIAEKFELPGATLSFHLNNLKQAGLIQVQRDGRSLIYSTDFTQMNALLAFLMKDCCGGRCTIPGGVDLNKIVRR